MRRNVDELCELTRNEISIKTMNKKRSSSSKCERDIIHSGFENITGSRPSSSSSPRIQKAKRIRFYHNGNKFFNGIVIPITPDRYRSLDNLTSELTNLLLKSVTLPSGVRNIYTMDGKKVCTIDDLEDGKSYVVSGKGEPFKKIEYVKTGTPRSRRHSNAKSTKDNASSLKVVSPSNVRPRIVTIIKHGIKPRKILRLLLNKRNSSNMEQVLTAFSEVARVAVRKVFTLSGQRVSDLPQLFNSDDVFFVYGNERPSHDDFQLDAEESKALQQYKKTTVPQNEASPNSKKSKEESNKTCESQKNLLEESEWDNTILPSPLKNKYIVGKTIGEGNFGVVRLCKEIESNKKYAVKIIDKLKWEGIEDMIENEIKILRKVNHRNIMALVAEQDTKNMLYLVCEYVAGGDLSFALSRTQKFPEDQAALMINHLASALAYLHNLNILHNDIKPKNLLLEVEGNRVVYLKLADFGYASEVTEPLFIGCDTSPYAAPEMLTVSGYGVKVDIWAAGVILYTLLCGYTPFVSEDNDDKKLFDSILSGRYDFPDEYWHDVSALAKELIQNMFQLSPELRFSAEDVLNHPWVQRANY